MPQDNTQEVYFRLTVNDRRSEDVIEAFTSDGRGPRYVDPAEVEAAEEIGFPVVTMPIRKFHELADQGYARAKREYNQLANIKGEISNDDFDQMANFYKDKINHSIGKREIVYNELDIPIYLGAITMIEKNRAMLFEKEYNAKDIIESLYANGYVPKYGDVMMFKPENQTHVVLPKGAAKETDYTIVAISNTSLSDRPYEVLLRSDKYKDEYIRLPFDETFLKSLKEGVNTLSDNLFGGINFNIASKPYSTLDYLDLLLTSPLFKSVADNMYLAQHDAYMKMPLTNGNYLYLNADKREDGFHYSMEEYRYVEEKKGRVKTLHYEKVDDLCEIVTQHALTPSDLRWKLHDELIKKTEEVLQMKQPAGLTMDITPSIQPGEVTEEMAKEFKKSLADTVIHMRNAGESDIAIVNYLQDLKDKWSDYPSMRSAINESIVGQYQFYKRPAVNTYDVYGVCLANDDAMLKAPASQVSLSSLKVDDFYSKRPVYSCVGKVMNGTRVKWDPEFNSRDYESMLESFEKNVPRKFNQEDAFYYMKPEGIEDGYMEVMAKDRNGALMYNHDSGEYQYYAKFRKEEVIEHINDEGLSPSASDCIKIITAEVREAENVAMYQSAVNKPVVTLSMEQLEGLKDATFGKLVNDYGHRFNIDLGDGQEHTITIGCLTADRSGARALAFLDNNFSSRSGSMIEISYDTFLAMAKAYSEKLSQGYIADLYKAQPVNNNLNQTTMAKSRKPQVKQENASAEQVKTAQQEKTAKKVKSTAKADKKEQTTKEKEHRAPQMVTVNGEKVTHAHAFQSNKNPDDWFFTAKIDGVQLRPQHMRQEDVKAWQERNWKVEDLMQNYYPTKLQKKVSKEEYQAANKLSDGRAIEKMAVYKEHDEQKPDFGKYHIYVQVKSVDNAHEIKMSKLMSREDLNAYFDRITTPAKLVEKNFGEELNLKSAYQKYQLPEEAKDAKVRINKDISGKWNVSVDLGDKGQTKEHQLSRSDLYSLFSTKTATREQLAAKYCNDEIKNLSAKVAVEQKQGLKR